MFVLCKVKLGCYASRKKVQFNKSWGTSYMKVLFCTLVVFALLGVDGVDIHTTPS